jgi:hypothetical protein
MQDEGNYNQLVDVKENFLKEELIYPTDPKYSTEQKAEFYDLEAKKLKDAASPLEEYNKGL